MSSPKNKRRCEELNELRPLFCANHCKKCQSSRGTLGINGGHNVLICAKNIGGMHKGAGCKKYLETLRHEFVHLMDHCTGFIDKDKLDPCEYCVCDELRAVEVSGTCKKDGLQWLKSLANGKPYDSMEDCIRKNAHNSCVTTCNWHLQPRPSKAERLEFIKETQKKCTPFIPVDGDDNPLPPID